MHFKKLLIIHIFVKQNLGFYFRFYKHFFKIFFPRIIDIPTFINIIITFYFSHINFSLLLI